MCFSWYSIVTGHLCHENFIWWQLNVNLKNATWTESPQAAILLLLQFGYYPFFVWSKLESQKVSHFLFGTFCPPSLLSGFSAVKHEPISVMKWTGVHPVTPWDLAVKERVGGDAKQKWCTNLVFLMSQKH